MKFRALRELDDTHGSVQLVEGVSGPHQHAGNTDIVLIPQPSGDPRDPLRWPRWKKLLPFVLVNFFAFMVSWVIGGLSQAFFVLSKELDQPIPKIAGLLSYCILTLGLGNIFWVPMALFLGKRPTFVAASLVFFVGCIWSSVSQSYESLLASRIVTAFAGGSTEALGAAIINDLFFLHERGRMMGWCVILLSSGNSLGPLCAGFMVSALGWRWFYWLCTIVCGVLFLAIVFCFPETRFERVLEMPAGPSTLPEGHEEHTMVDMKTLETTTPVALDAEHVEMGGSTAASTTPRTTTYLQMLKLWSGTTDESILTVLIRPFPTLAYPAVIWAIVGYSISLACVVTVNSLNSFVLQAPPYNFSPAINGLVNIPALMGTLFGAFTGGYLTDAYSTWDARRHGGMFRPESRLPLLVIPGVFVPTGLFMFGYGATQQWHWAILFVANGFINVGITSVASIAMVYVSDSYFPVAHEALLVINGLKNVVAFGYSYGVTPWIVRAGFEKPFATLAGLFWAIMLVSVGFYVLGERIRSSSAKWKIIYSS